MDKRYKGRDVTSFSGPKDLLLRVGFVPRRRPFLLLHEPGHVRMVQHQPQVRTGDPLAEGVQNHLLEEVGRDSFPGTDFSFFAILHGAKEVVY